jgi:hypothetical protein
LATCLPERWLVRGYAGDGSLIFESWSQLLPVKLQTGPDPFGQADADGLTLGMRWMHDFEAAVQQGMAIRQQLDTAEVNALRRIIVFGVKGTLDPQESGRAFFGLLEAHHYTDGLAFVPQGTPTNNTPAGRAGQRAENSLRDILGEEAFAFEVQQVCPPVGELDGNILARALGVPPPVAPATPTEAEKELFPFAHVRYAAGKEQKAAEEMNRVLWPALGRYFAEQMVRGSALRRVPDDWGSYFLRFVRGRGPLRPYAPGTNLWVVARQQRGSIQYCRWSRPGGFDRPRRSGLEVYCLGLDAMAGLGWGGSGSAVRGLE